jgi:chemotaxis protein methyltransferase CheR
MSVTESNFAYLRELVQKHSGIHIDADKDYLVDSRIGPLLDPSSGSSIDHLLASLKCRSFANPHRKVIEAMTNNESWFFRDFQPFEALRLKILPELLRAKADQREIVIWSAACSFGQEPYSLAMCIHQNFMLPDWKFRIIATDLAGHALDRAREARYSQMEISRGLPTPLLARYFRPVGVQWELTSEIRNMVEFRQMNLAERWPSLPQVDILMLRNVLIYFEVDLKKQVLAKTRQVLSPSGYMFMGAAETTLNLDDGFDRIPFDRSAYYRVRNQ